MLPIAHGRQRQAKALGEAALAQHQSPPDLRHVDRVSFHRDHPFANGERPTPLVYTGGIKFSGRRGPPKPAQLIIGLHPLATEAGVAVESVAKVQFADAQWICREIARRLWRADQRRRVQDLSVGENIDGLGPCGGRHLALPVIADRLEVTDGEVVMRPEQRLRFGFAHGRQGAGTRRQRLCGAAR